MAPKFGSEKVSRYTGVSQLQLRVSRYTVQLSISLVFWGVFCLFSKVFRGSPGEKCSLVFSKRPRKDRVRLLAGGPKASRLQNTFSTLLGLGTLFGHEGSQGPKGPGDTPWGTPFDTPVSATLSGTLPGHSGRDCCSWPGCSQYFNVLKTPPRICVKWVPFVKLAFSLGNRAHFGPKMGYFRLFRTTFSTIVAQILVFTVISLFPPF